MLPRKKASIRVWSSSTIRHRSPTRKIPSATFRLADAGGGPSASCDTRGGYWYLSIGKNAAMFD